MNKKAQLKSSLLLLLAACIWGFAFVAQRESMNYIGPFTFNGVRFALGAFSLLPVILLSKKKPQNMGKKNADLKSTAIYGVLLGMILFCGSSLQQIGLIYTTAGKAAFITGLYIVIVPFLGLFLKQRLNINNWVGALIAAIGLFFLCVTDRFTFSNGDLLELGGAFFWSAHILIIDKISRKIDVLTFSLFQIVTCSILSFGVAIVTETIDLISLSHVLIPLLYGGVCSVGIAYTLQVEGQKNTPPTQAAIIFAMESVFAATGGFIILNEQLGTRGILGCLLMLVGMILPQLPQMKIIRGVSKRNGSEQKREGA